MHNGLTMNPAQANATCTPAPHTHTHTPHATRPHCIVIRLCTTNTDSPAHANVSVWTRREASLALAVGCYLHCLEQRRGSQAPCQAQPREEL